MAENKQEIIIYNTADGKAAVSLYARDGMVWMNQSQLAELFDTSVPNISMHISNILKENELDRNSVIKDYLTTASDGKEYSVTFYALDMILAIGFRVRSKRGTQFRIWANRNLKEYMRIDDGRGRKHEVNGLFHPKSSIINKKQQITRRSGGITVLPTSPLCSETYFPHTSGN